MITDVRICNLALGYLGDARIMALGDDSEEARACADFFAIVRDAVLQAFPWSFAGAYATLALADEMPPFGYAYRYALPLNCLAVRDIEPAGPFEVVGRHLETDQEQVKLRYTQAVTDPGLYTPLFAQALAARLAAEISYRLNSNESQRQAAFSVYTGKLAEAMQAEARGNERRELSYEAPLLALRD